MTLYRRVLRPDWNRYAADGWRMVQPGRVRWVPSCFDFQAWFAKEE